MKKQKWIRKGMAFVLSLAMVAGLVPAMPGGANKVQAATGTGTELSVSAYATKEQLMTAFTPDSNGNATTIGKLVFGKNSSGNPQEWYILGNDAGVSGDNTIIFAASPIATGQVFEDDYRNNKTEPSLWSDCNYNGTSITEVFPNHYGASDLRVALKDMADGSDTAYFTSAEQGLMNATTVTTNDKKNGGTYTTTDKLYALAVDSYGSTIIKAGTNNQTVLAKSKYWSSGGYFWLRSPSDSNGGKYGLVAGSDRYNYVIHGNVYDGLIAVKPASNLNLSSVLFASAATAASSDTKSEKITDGTAMTLRLDGTGNNIGTVAYNNTTGDIKAVKGSTSQAVALVVQGNDGTNDWYYSKQITGTEGVNASDIKSALSLTSDIDLSACKIWLEITEDNLTYAVNATETTIKIIHSVAITGIATPAVNTTLDTSASCATEGVGSTTPQITWTPNDTTAGYNTSYMASITLTADTGYEFTDSTTATVLGNSATSVNMNTDGTLTVTYAFPATAKDKLTSITAPQAITVANGTAYSAMNLPATVNIVTEGNTVTSAPVKWDTTTPASGSYDPAVLTEQTVTLNGEVTCPDGINANGVELTTTITITISATDIVGAPIANPIAGTYSKNQSVELTSSTEGATIYYTTDGSEPTITGGAPSGTTQQYTAPIAVTGTEGQSVETTIKAIAVKERMQDSSVETFTYTIHQIPVAKYTYATKTQLMDGTFAPITDGTAVNIGKLVFGKNSSGEAQEWYILGKDERVSGDNTIIFAASPIATGQVFEDDCYNSKTDTSLWSDCDYSGVSITVVSPNHYGASDLRVALQGIAKNTNCFTPAEQGMMNATTVTTYDYNNGVTYTTTDNLYALQGEYQKDKLWAGTSDSTVLARSSYWSNPPQIWLRSPCFFSSQGALFTYPGSYAYNELTKSARAVRPASNLNLSCVLFASSAKAASSDTAEAGPIAEGTAMTLRLNGTVKNIGTVTYNATTGDIKATKGSTEGDVALVVQGNDGINDWYYSKKIDAAETVNASAIKSALNLSSDIDLSACKIWLETTDSTENLIYAVGATEVLSITSVEITGIETPAANTTLDTEASCATTGVSSTTPQITWTPSDSTAGYNTSYTASITLTADTGYEFINSTTATVNGNPETGVTKNADGTTLTVTYDFPATAKRKITGVTAPTVPTNNTFTTYYGFEGYADTPVSVSSNEFGNQAMVTLEGTALVDSTNEAMNVTWTVANADDAPYDKTPGAENTFRWRIPASEFPDYDASACQGYDATTGTITGTVAITNKDYTPVTITGENVTVTYPGEDTLDVSRYFTIDKNAGTPTYELLGTSTGTGTLEGATLTMTTLGTFVVKVSTPINGVYNKGEHTLTITVNKATPYIKTTPTATAITYGKTLADATLTGGSVQYSSEDDTAVDGSFAWKEDTTKPAVADSNTTAYKVVFTPTNKNYNTVETDITVTVNKADAPQNKPDNTMNVDYSKEKVSDITLPEGWAWQDAYKEKTLTVGTAVKATAVYTGADKGNYATESVKISITRLECTHATTEVKNEKDATCTEKGYSGDTYCKVCGEKVETGQDINALGHDFAAEFTVDKEATCAEAGSKSKHCSRCEEKDEITPIPKKEHTWDSGKVTKEATCVEKGVKSYKCTVDGCDGAKTEDIDALGHDYASEFTVDKEATCAEAGSQSKHCSRCDAKSEVTEIPVDKTKHGKTEIKDVKDATCTEKGYSGDTYCKVCGEKVETGQDINALGHDMTKTVSAEVKATCTETGKEAVKGCSRCDYTEGGETTNALGHDFAAEFTVDKEATCKEEGSKSKHCSRCDEVTDVTPIDKLTTHSYVNGVCSVCDDIFKATVDGVTYQVMTETGADGKPVGKLVTVSGNDVPQVAVAVIGTSDDFAVSDGKVTVPSGITGSSSEQTFVVTKIAEDAFAGESSNAVTEIVVPATVTEVGTGAFGTASTITFKGNTAPSGIAGAITETVTTVNVPEGAADSYREELDENSNIVEAHTHTFDTKWTYDDTYHWHVATCGHAEKVSDKAVHTFGEWTVTKEATEDAEGVKTITCSVCGKTKTEVIPKKTATTQEPPKKGDVVADDKASVTVEVLDVKKKEVEYKEPDGKKAKTVSIPATVKIDGVTYKVTKIDDNAFKNNKTVTKVTVGSNIKTIGKNAFSCATKLKTVKIGKNVTTIGSNAFKGCSSLTSVTLGSKATKIGANAFSGCKKLKTIKITSTKLTSKTVAKNAFKGLTKATTIKVPKKKLSAYKKLFKQKGLSSKVKVIGY